MVNERYDDKPEGQDESEYHFSDDQVNYDLEPEAIKAGTAVASAPKSSLSDKLKQNRRVGIGIVIFIMLIALVYKMVSPPTTEPSTDIVQQSIPVAKPAPIVTQQVQAAPQAAPAPIDQPQQTAQIQPPPAVQSQPPAPIAQSVPAPLPPAANPVANGAPAPLPEAPVATASAPDGSNLNDRVTTLEQQNSTAMNVIQAQVAQKITENETQVTEMRTQIQELNARLASMEVAFHQLTKILRSERAQSGESMTPPPATNPDMEAGNVPGRAIQPKVNYTVQAIIPGRAWLKSDAGDTVTVAEGDVIKDFGKITHIDPYDGVVNIDTGKKMVTLSYGMSGD